MFRKVTLIVFLAISLGAFLVLRPYIFSKEEEPTIVDILPNGDYLIKAYLLDVAKEASGMMYYHKVPFREFLSKEFLLGQAKAYGLNLQQPCYLFANEDASWGAFLEIQDSSKIFPGVERLKRMFDLSDTTINKKKVYFFKDNDLYFSYDHQYLFFYQGKNFENIFHHVRKSRKNTITPTWRLFLNAIRNQTNALTIYSNSPKIKELGIQTALFYPTLDSTHIGMSAHIKSIDSIPFKQKLSGQGLKTTPFTSRYLNLHLDVERLRQNPNHILYQYLVKNGKKIGFPTEEFIQAWDGDLSFHQGGLITVNEKYIEFELDENFEAKEVEKVRATKVVGFDMFFTTNEKGKNFLASMERKGVMTKEEQLYRFLFSPALRLKNSSIKHPTSGIVQNRHLFHATTRAPKLTQDPVNWGIWTYRGTPFEFYLDSVKTFDLYTKMRFPAKRIIERGQKLQFKN